MSAHGCPQVPGSTEELVASYHRYSEEKDYKEPPPAPLFEAEVLLPCRVRGHLPVPLYTSIQTEPPPTPTP